MRKTDRNPSRSEQATGTPVEKPTPEEAPERSSRPSSDELERMVAMHLAQERSRIRFSPWLLRVFSALVAAVMLLLLSLWLPD